MAVLINGFTVEQGNHLNKISDAEHKIRLALHSLDGLTSHWSMQLKAELQKTLAFAHFVEQAEEQVFESLNAQEG